MKIISSRLLNNVKELFKMLLILLKRLIGYREQLMFLETKENVDLTGLLPLLELFKDYML